MSRPTAGRFARILLATDGSPGSMHACAVAAKVARAFGSEVTILSAIPSIGALAAPLEGDFYSKIINKAEDSVEKAAAVFKKAGVAVTEKEVPQGRASPAETILNYAKDENSDLIVMGTRGMGGFRRMALGSVSSEVALHAGCATLVVRAPAKSREPGGLGKIMVAVDGSENAQRALETAIEMAKKLSAELLVAHVVNVPGVLWSLGLPGSTVPAKEIEEDAERIGEELVAKAMKFARDAGVKAKGEAVTKLASPAQGIVELADQVETDLVVVGTRGLGGFKKLLLGSVANSVLHYVHCSVMVVR